MEKKRVHFYLTEDTLDQLKTIKEKSGITVAELVRRMIEDRIEAYQEKYVKGGDKAIETD